MKNAWVGKGIRKKQERRNMQNNKQRMCEEGELKRRIKTVRGVMFVSSEVIPSTERKGGKGCTQ